MGKSNESLGKPGRVKEGHLSKLRLRTTGISPVLPVNEYGL
jgi:hypothetical protein